jgi:ribosome-associated protein
METEAFVEVLAKSLSDKKGVNIVILDLRGISSFTDFFVICSGTSEPQLKALTDAVREAARERAGRNPLKADGLPASQWVAVDFGDVIVHIFHHETREYYDLESLWRDAPMRIWRDATDAL